MATILDTFISVFDADTRNLDKGYKQSKKTTDDLVQSMKNADKQAAATAAKLKSFALKAAGFLGVTLSASKMVASAIAQADTINAMAQTADAIGTTAGELDALQKAFMDSGATADAAAESTRRLFERAQQEGKDGVTLMRELAQAAEGLDKASAIDLFNKMGITDRKVQEQLLKGRQALDDQMRAHKRAGVVTKEQVEIAQRYSNAQSKLTNALEIGARSIMSAILPAVTWLVEKLSSLLGWMNENKPFVIGFFSAIAAIVTAVYLPAMVSAAAATLAALSPVILIGAAIAAAAVAIGLIVDDIYNWIEGNDSLIGQLIEKYPIIGDIINGIIAYVKWLAQAYVDLGVKAYEIFQQMIDGGKVAWDWMKDVADGIYDAFMTAFDYIDTLVDDFSKAWDKFAAGLVGAIRSGFDLIKSIVTSVIDWIMSKIGAVTGAVGKFASWFGFGSGSSAHQEAAQYIEGAAANPMNPVTSNAVTNSTRGGDQSVNVGEVVVNAPGADASQVAGAVRGELDKQMKSMQSETASGVDR